MSEVKIDHKIVGGRHPCYIVAEIGINHNGDIDIAKKFRPPDIAQFPA